jgi:shikimate kinase
LRGLSRPVVLAGPPCSGKTTCGRLAAGLLGVPFEDLDCLVCEAAGRTVDRIILESGERFFRRLESKCLHDALRPGRPVLLAVGGGALLEAASLQAVLYAAILITLWAPDDVLASRLGSSERPLASDRASLLALLGERRAHYASLPCRLDTSTLGVRECAELIARAALEARDRS